MPLGKGVKVIAHVSNDIGGWGKGFVLALSRRRPEPDVCPASAADSRAASGPAWSR